jgi:hypothetical protein
VRADAQEHGRLGVTMGYPAAIGILWHVSDRVALRPEFSFSQSDSSSESIVSATTDFWSLGTGISALFFSPVSDNLRTYVAPRFSYVRTHGEGDVTKSTTTSYSIAGMFGGQYSLGRRFAAFGEVGFGYSRQTGTATSTVVSTEVRTTNRGNSVGTRTGVGVVLYF